MTNSKRDYGMIAKELFVRKRGGLLVLSVALMLGIVMRSRPCDAAKRRFTVADDISLVGFGVDGSTPFAFSPDRRYVEVLTERGRLDLNQMESTLRIFRTNDLRQFSLDPNSNLVPFPVWEITKSTYKDAPIIFDVRWLADSSGLAFLVTTASGNNQLVLADIRTRRVSDLTPQTQHVTAFDIRNRTNFVYTMPSPTIGAKAREESLRISVVGTGRFLDNLMFPESQYPLRSRWHDLSELWAVIDGRRFRVENKLSGEPIPLHRDGQAALALSPDGRSVITALAVADIPKDWEVLYPPMPYSVHRRIQAGRQDIGAIDGQLYVSEYVVIQLLNDEVKPLTHSPIGNAVGWEAFPAAGWSADGKFVVLSNVFVPPRGDAPRQEPRRPCVGVADLTNGSITCVESIKQFTSDRYEEGFHWISTVQFAHGLDSQVVIGYSQVDGPIGSTTYVRTSDQSWTTASGTKLCDKQNDSIELTIKQDLNDPPVLVVTDLKTNVSRTFFDPNPQLKDLDLGTVSVLKWKDKSGRDWTGGLYMPPDYVRGRRYPLVIQPHGFLNHVFVPSGLFTSADAAQELAAREIIVLQVADCPYTATAAEAACNVAGYESAINRLDEEGLIDRDRIGIVGFSRTCYYVMQALTTSRVRFRAASITSGVVMGYVNYIDEVDAQGNNLREEPVIYGATPFGEGLQQWFEHSPEFNTSKIETPLLVVAVGAPDVHWMWEPYAALRYQNKPVDMVVLTHEGTHPLTNPAQREVSQGGTVDWFDFWLNQHEDADPAKSEQYVRWRGLRSLQEKEKRID
jgi:hypothetical protein